MCALKTKQVRPSTQRSTSKCTHLTSRDETNAFAWSLMSVQALPVSFGCSVKIAFLGETGLVRMVLITADSTASSTNQKTPITQNTQSQITHSTPLRTRQWTGPGRWGCAGHQKAGNH